ncbi:MAG: C69 family dipeptidase, partial [Lachnospiraceae bacterium]|nr:C69 family dipeptidase [Lachnospiraceae bacterium]
PNQQGIDWFDFTDAFGAKEEHMCSADMIDFIRDNHLDLTMRVQSEDDDVAKDTQFDVRAAFGSHDDADHVYNTPRAWFMLKKLNPRTYTWDGPGADYQPGDDDLPWCMCPEHKVTVDDVKYVLSAHFQGTPFDPYGRYGHAEDRGKYRPIGISRNNFLSLTQIRPNVPEAISALQWIAMGSNVFNAFAPFYANVDTTPEYLSGTTGEVTTENFYWVNRLIGALADAHWAMSNSHIERYQNKVINAGMKLIHETDAAIQKKKGKEICKALEKANEEMADILKKETGDVLGKVLYEASCEMKNGFSRSDA